MLLLLCQQKEVFPPSTFGRGVLPISGNCFIFLAAYFFGNCSLPCSCYGRWLPFSQRSNHCLSYNIVFFYFYLYLLSLFAGSHSLKPSTAYFLLFFNATCCSAVEFFAVRSIWPFVGLIMKLQAKSVDIGKVSRAWVKSNGNVKPTMNKWMDLHSPPSHICYCWSVKLDNI